MQEKKKTKKAITAKKIICGILTVVLILLAGTFAFSNEYLNAEPNTVESIKEAGTDIIEGTEAIEVTETLEPTEEPIEAEIVEQIEEMLEAVASCFQTI